MKNRYNLSNNIDTDFNLESKFVYNFYSAKENINNDNKIINESVNLLSFNELDINLRVGPYDRRSIIYTDFVNEKIRPFLLEINDKSLAKRELDYFNKTSEERKYLNYTNIDISEEIIRKNNIKYNLNEQIHTEAIDYITKNKKISLNRNYIDIAKHYLPNNTKEIDNFEKYFRSDLNETFEEKEKLHISEKYNSLFETSVSSLDRNFKYYFSYVGILIEKYKFVDNVIQLKDTKFYNMQELTPLISSTRELKISSENLNIKDSAVRYGEKYQYALYPVYVITLPKKENYYVAETFLVCDIPQFTKEIVCIETKRPINPTNISFNLLDSKNLKISWAKPLEEQGDVKGYQIFKRHDIESPYTLVHQIEFFNEQDKPQRNNKINKKNIEVSFYEKTDFIDLDFSLTKIQIYAICAIDARGYTSNYSEQIAVFYENSTKSLEIDLISKSGAPLHMPNLLIPRKTRFFENDDKIVSNTPYENDVSKFTLYVTPETHSIILDEDELKVLGDNYKFSIFKIESDEKVLNDIKILNFTKPD